MASKIKVDQIEGSTGSSITIPSGQTLTIADGLASSTITSGTLADARIPDLNASKITAGTIASARLGSGTANSSTFLRGDGTFAAPGGGAFGQVQYRTDNTQYANSNQTNYVTATNTYIDITPSSSSASKKILINFNMAFYMQHNASDIALQYVFTRTVGGSTTDIYTSTSTEIYRNDAGNIRFIVPIWYEDAPQTTSAVRYNFKFRNPHSASTITVNENGSTTRMLAYEVN